MDVQAKGYYPAHKLKEFEREGMTIQMESEDLAIIQKGTVDYIGFSYYMSTVSTAYPEEVKYRENTEKSASLYDRWRGRSGGQLRKRCGKSI